MVWLEPGVDRDRIGIAAQSVGMAKAALEAALAYAKEREAFGQPIIDHQAVAFRLADMATQIEAARLMVLNAASIWFRTRLRRRKKW